MNNSIIFRITLFSFLIFNAFTSNVLSQNNANQFSYPEISLSRFASSANHWYGIKDKSNIINFLPEKPRYQTNEITKIADNILLFQRNNGGWLKNYDMQAILTSEQVDSVVKTKASTHTTFDNSTTYTQIEYLASVYSITHTDKYKKACLRGIQFCLNAQYPNGGWPQYFPIETKNYSRRITYNDGAYMGIMELMQKIATRDSDYNFVSEPLRKKVQNAYNKGLECILNTQIVENGRMTVWCQQHDEITMQPAWARAFEPPSICNGESVSIVLFLMKIKNPDDRIIKSIQNAVKWFAESKILYTRVETINSEAEDTKYRTITTDNIVVTDSLAKPIWTRYYELGSHRPQFCNRDSKFVYSLAGVSRERRVGYGWYTYEPQKVLNKYPAWQKKWAPNENVLK
ncbi:MAG TPA: pectate lyase [Paludibacter sp.]|nr:pectate lyase [Paludibacter sp.]